MTARTPSRKRHKRKPEAPSLFDTEVMTPIEDREFTREMESAYIEYSMSVIVARALPDIRDGLKPVQRRILWGMQTGGIRATGAHRKCAKVVGEVMGSYHPHGDAAIYDALVRMAQPFSYYVPLVDGQGNFGSQGFPPAAMRYTECRMTLTAESMLAGIAEDTVDFVSNYDGETTEPSALPAAFPNLLVNGAAGIAVGMATNIPTHNPLEVLDAALIVLDSPTVTTKKLLTKVKGPDFTSGCDVIDAGGDAGIVSAYETGMGRVTLRATVETRPASRGAQQLIFRNLPPTVSVGSVAEQIVDHVKKGKLQSLSNVVDASDKTGQELQIFVKKGHPVAVVTTELYKLTKLEDTFSINMRALVDGVPRVCSLRDMLVAFCDHRMDVILRRSLFRKAKAEARRHIVRALIKALDIIDEVIAAIRASRDALAAKAALIELLCIDDVQAQAIIEMQLRRLTSLETQALADELKELNATIRDLTRIIDDEDTRRSVVRDEMVALRANYQGMGRRSRIVALGPARVEGVAENLAEGVTEGASDELAGEAGSAASGVDPYAAVDVQVRVLRGGLIEVTTPGGRRKRWSGSDAQNAPVADLTLALNDRLSVITDDGRAWTIALLDVPQDRRMRLLDLSTAKRDVHVVAAFGISSLTSKKLGNVEAVPDRTLLVASTDGKVKRLEPGDAVASRRDGLAIIRLDGDARVAGAAFVGEDDPCVFVSSDGYATRVVASEIPLQGRAAAGVRAIRLTAGAVVIAANVAGDERILVCGSGAGWVTSILMHEVPLHARGAKGARVAKTDSNRGDLAGAVVVERRHTVYVVDADRKVHDVVAGEARRGATGRHVTDSIADVFALPSA